MDLVLEWRLSVGWFFNKTIIVSLYARQAGDKYILLIEWPMFIHFTLLKTLQNSKLESRLKSGSNFWVWAGKNLKSLSIHIELFFPAVLFIMIFTNGSTF